jgi:hypothetical protein
MLQPIRLLSLAVMLAGLLAGCDRQVSSDYQGESLLRIEGSVAIPLGFEGRELVPVIGFYANSGRGPQCDGSVSADYVRILDVSAEGDFPSQFTLDVLDPPPEEAFREVVAGQPPVAIGHIMAMTPDHPDALLIRPNDADTYTAWRESDVADCEGHETDDTHCFVLHTCTLDGDRCLHRTLSCPNLQPWVYNDCELVTERGDESVGAAGYSVNYILVYFRSSIDAGSGLAEIYAGGEAISAGYHLYRSAQLGPRDTTSAGECAQQASNAARERYNMESGTDLRPIDSVQGLEFEAYAKWRCYWVEEIATCNEFLAEPEFEEVIDEPIAIELGALGSNS